MEGEKLAEKESREGESGTALQQKPETLPSTEFVKVEKNLASLGFFSPSSKRSRDEKSKTVKVTIVVDGKRVEAKATIAPTALFGLPITADQDKWLALHKILSDIQARDGEVKNPVSFTSAQLLALLKIYKDSGKNYRDVSEWLDVMVGTTIISEGAVYVGGKRAFGKDVFHVFDRAVSFGKELPDGSIADKNYIWLSEWQRKNINDHHQLPIDLDTYRQLKNHIAKALVPLLQIWLYATRDDGVFEKRYDELCQILSIRQWGYLSKIREKLGPSLDELKEFGYLADWQVSKMSDSFNYKVTFYHGDKFYGDHRARLSRKKSVVAADGNHSDRHHSAQPKREHVIQPVQQQVPIDPSILLELTRRGITETKARELLANLKPGQDVLAQIELTDQLIERAGFKIQNPPGFYIRQIERNALVPDHFETTARRKTRAERERRERERRLAEDARQELEDDYADYCSREVERYIEENPSVFQPILEAKAKEESERGYGSWLGSPTKFAMWAAKNEIRKQVPLLTFEEFADRKRQGSEPHADATSDTKVAEPEAAVQDREPVILDEVAASTVPDVPLAAAPLLEPPAILISSEHEFPQSVDFGEGSEEPPAAAPESDPAFVPPAPDESATDLITIPQPPPEGTGLGPTQQPLA